jgi:ABC-type lipoprotein release transport system permease subunit
MQWWVRATLRRNRWSRWFVVVLTGLSVGLVAASWQAERRAAGSLDRLTAYSDAPDAVIVTCPPGVDPSVDESLYGLCATPETAAETRGELEQIPDIESVTEGAMVVMALLDPAAPNGWGRVTLIEASAGPSLLSGRPIMVAGRQAGNLADDEIVLSEEAAESADLHVGDTVQMAGWTSTDGRFDVPPDSEPFDSTVVGIVRFVQDLVSREARDLSGTLLGGSVHAGQGWTDAHAHGLFGYGWAVAAQVRDNDVDRLNELLLERWQDRVFDLSSVVDTNLAAIDRVIDTERHAVTAFSIIGALASAAVLALLLVRQLARDTADAATLTALGATRRDLMNASVLRALFIGVPAAVLTCVLCVVLSPLGPVGVARRAEPHPGVRVDATVLAVTGCAVAALSAAMGVVTAVRLRRVGARHKEISRISGLLAPLGPAPRVGASFTRGGLRAAVVVAALGIAAVVASAGLVASFDRVEGDPLRYGAWWDLVVGDFSDAELSQAGADLISANTAVAAAATLADLDAVIDDVPARVISSEVFAGEVPSVAVDGRMPTYTDEIVLGRSLAADLGVTVGDTVEVRVSETNVPPVNLVVVGIAVLNDPISLDIGPGEGALVLPGAIHTFEAQSTQSLLVRLDRSLDRQEAVDSVLDDFDASVVAATPQSDLRNLSGIRNVPFYIAALLTVLALATFMHAMVTMIHRHRRDLAVLAATGMTRWQRLLVVITAALAVVVLSATVGAVLGVIGGRALWSSLADRIGLASGPVVEAGPLIVIIAAAVTAALAIATAAQVRAAWGPAADALHGE